MGLSVRQIAIALEQASALIHPYRAMRVTMECGHLRLSPEISTRMGIGSLTDCRICPAPEGRSYAERQVVNVEETGVLHEDWAKLKMNEEEA